MIFTGTDSEFNLKTNILSKHDTTKKFGVEFRFSKFQESEEIEEIKITFEWSNSI